MSQSINEVLELFENSSFFASKALDSLKMDVIKTASNLAPETHISKPSRIKVGRPSLERHIAFALKDYNESFADKITSSSFKFDKTMFFLILLNLYQKELNRNLPMHYQVNFSNEYQEHVYRTYMEIALNNKKLNLMNKVPHTFNFAEQDSMQLKTYEKSGGIVNGKSNGHEVYCLFIPRETNGSYKELHSEQDIFKINNVDNETEKISKKLFERFNWRYLQLNKDNEILRNEKEFISIIMHERTRDRFSSVKLSNEFGRETWGPINEGTAQFVDLLVERELEDSKSSTVEKEDLDLSLYSENFDSYEWGEWVMKLLDERLAERDVNGKVDKTRSLVEDFVEEEKERSNHHPVNFFKFIMPDKTKKMIGRSEETVEKIYYELEKLENSFSNKNSPKKRSDADWTAALSKSGFGTYKKLKKEVRTFKRKKKRYDHIMHKEVVLKAVEQKEDFKFVEKKFNNVLQKELKDLMELIHDLKKLKSQLQGKRPEWKGLNEFIKEINSLEDKLEREIKFIESRNQIKNSEPIQ